MAGLLSRSSAVLIPGTYAKHLFMPTNKPLASSRLRPGHATSSDGSSLPAGPSSSGLLSAPEQQVAAYSTLAAVESGLAAALTLAPNWSLQQLGFVPTPATSLQLVSAGAYLWLKVSCLLCLKDAATHNRLSSDTYKRLNLGLMYQAIIFAVLLFRHKALLTSHVLGGAIAIAAATVFINGRIYAVSAGGFSLQTIVKGFGNGLRDLLQLRNNMSTFYAFCAGLALLQFLWHFPSSATPLFSQDLGPIALLLKQARGAGMVLAGVVWYVLKDAADRGRLAASTFKQLNLAMAVVAALQLWAYWQMSVAGVPLNRQLWRVLMGTGLLVVAVCDWQFFAKKAGA